MPALMMSGNPQARYSAFFVGEEASFEKHRLMNDTPASPAERYEGTTRAGTDSTLKLPAATLRLFINSFTRSWLPLVSQTTCASGRRRLNLAKKSAISSVRYQPSREPLYTIVNLSPSPSSARRRARSSSLNLNNERSTQHGTTAC